MKGRTVTEYDELIAAIREQMTQLGMTGENLDRIANLPDRLGGKILGSKRVRGLANETFGRVLEGAGLEIVVVENPQKAERVREWLKKWGAKANGRGPRLRTIARTKRATWLMTSKDARRNARELWKKRTPDERAQWARTMNKTRWKKHRKKQREAKRREIERKRAERLAAAAATVASRIASSEIVVPTDQEQPQPSCGARTGIEHQSSSASA